MNNLIILAATKGNDINLNIPKALVPIIDKPMISYIIEETRGLSFDQTICVVGYHKDEVINMVGENIICKVQSEQKGTADAVRVTLDLLKDDGYSIIIPCDTPLIDSKIINRLINEHKEKKNNITICTFSLDNPYGYGRILRNLNGNVYDIVEESDANLNQLNLKEVNSGIYCVDSKILKEAILEITKDKQSTKYNLTDMVKVMKNKAKIGSLFFLESHKFLSIDDLEKLSIVEEELIKSINKKHMINGVKIINPASVIIGKNVFIEKGTIIYPNSMILGDTKIGSNSIIGPNSKITDSIISNNVVVEYSVISDSYINKNTRVGPFVHLRMNTVIGENNRIGNFVEIKNSTIGNKTNAAHLTYIGDTTCGSEVNWGCGCVTVNYDGKNKYKTTIGDKVFIGCNTNLIAPVVVESESFIAAGSTITNNVEKGDFAIARAKQINKEDYAKKYGFKN